eukprot:TRINITY_DN91951_c0_g1_i1.p1 TRINITY_DN91951_c0_g1~~TRINITY_DN91951_c0_g1_i1.p1  ORF type:complete len:219 (+),score=26.49 TRINITY_DN91951_c0_g1_i1:102-758(+)
MFHSDRNRSSVGILGSHRSGEPGDHSGLRHTDRASQSKARSNETRSEPSRSSRNPKEPRTSTNQSRSPAKRPASASASQASSSKPVDLSEKFDAAAAKPDLEDDDIPSQGLFQAVRAREGAHRHHIWNVWPSTATAESYVAPGSACPEHHHPPSDSEHMDSGFGWESDLTARELTPRQSDVASSSHWPRCLSPSARVDSKLDGMRRIVLYVRNNFAPI